MACPSQDDPKQLTGRSCAWDGRCKNGARWAGLNTAGARSDGLKWDGPERAGFRWGEKPRVCQKLAGQKP